MLSNTAIEGAPRCPRCGYNLTGLPEPRCPECGHAFTSDEWTEVRQFGDIVPPPRWERRGHVNAVGAFVGTLFTAALRPRRTLRGIRRGDSLMSAVAFWVLLIPAATVFSVAFLVVSAHVLHLFDQGGGRFHPVTQYLLWRFTGPGLLRNLLWTLIRCATFMLAGLLVWLPTLVVLDLWFWRKREAFRLLAKGLLYLFVWWFWAIVIVSRVANDLLLRVDSDWHWGFTGGWSRAGAWPWVCWLAAALITLQWAFLLWFIGSRKCVFRIKDLPGRGAMGLILTGGWLLGMYLLLFDRHIHVRFHLQFIIEELHHLSSSMQ